MTQRSGSGALPALAFGAGVIVTIEFSAAGLLPDLAEGLGRSLEEAGWLVSIFALSSSLLGPLVTAKLGGRAAGPALAALLASFGMLNLLAAGAPGYWSVFAIRAAEGALLPAYISLAIAAVMLGAEKPQGRALAGLNVGVAVGAVVALPTAVAFAGRLDWQAVFAALGVLALTAATTVLLMAPRAQLPGSASATAMVGLLRRSTVLGHLGLSVCVFAALFCAYAYLSAYLRELAGLEPDGVAVALTLFALAGLAGNWVAGRVVDTEPLRITAAVMVVLALALILVGLSAGRPVLLAPPLILWGAAHTAAFLACQSRLLQAAPDHLALASALNISACNLGIAVGSALGGVAVDAFAVEGSVWGSVALAALAAIAAAYGSVRASKLRDTPPGLKQGN